MKVLHLSTLLLFLLFVSPLFSQNGASIGGTVTDATGAAIQGATVTATDENTGIGRTSTTNKSGIYSIPNLSAGAYGVRVEKEGFQSAEFKHTPLTVAQALTLDAKLGVGSVAQSVEISGNAISPIETETSQLSTLVNSKTMVDLPLLTRNPYELVLLSPGTNQTNDGNNGFSVNGSRDRNNNFLLDGVDNNDTSVPGGPSGVISVNPDSAQEFRVITNTFNAEYGRNTGAIIDVITRSGSNQFHGDAYWFGRYNALGARDFFNRAPAKQDPYVRNDFGYSVGGPIIKDRTFFFINNEYQRFRTTLTNTSIVPTAAFKSGVFTTPDGEQFDLRTPASQGNLTGLGLDPTIAKTLRLLPDPNAGDVILGMTGLLNFASPDNFNSYTWTGKLDHTLTDRQQVTLRYAFNRGVDSNPFHSDFAPGLDIISSPFYAHGVLAGLTSTLSATMVNDFKFGWNKNYAAFNSNCASIFDPITGTDAVGNGRDLNAPDAALGLGPLNAFGCNGLFDSAGQSRNTGTTSYSDNLTLVRGNHTLEFGGDFRNVRSSGFADFNARDNLSFNRYANSGGTEPAIDLNPPAGSSLPVQSIQDLSWFLVGGTSTQFQAQFFNKSGTRTQTDDKRFRQHEFDGFIQDSWKVKSNLTLNYGLRYQFNGVPFEENANFTNLLQNPDSFTPTYTFTLAGPGTGHQVYNNDSHNFEPRIGFAWDPYKDGKTSIRAGYGIFHDRIFDNVFGLARSNPPFQQSVFNFFPAGTIAPTPESVPFGQSIPPGLTFSNGANQVVTLLDPNIKMPESQNWDFGIQRELFTSTVFELDYVGSHGTHVIQLLDAVPPDPALVQQAIADCVAVGASNGGCASGDPTGIISGGVLYSGLANIGVPPSIRETALQTGGSFPISNITRTNADSSYNALQAKVTKRLSHGLQLGAAYTWSHAIDDSNDPLTPEAGTGSFPIDSRNPNRTYRGNSDNDIRHRGVINFSYELPFGRRRAFLQNGIAGRALEGIQMAGIVTAQTGHPYTVFTNIDNGRTGIIGSFPDVIGNPFANAGPRITESGVVTGAANLSAFTQSFIGHIGDSGRNQFYGPHYTNADVVLTKNIGFSEGFRVQVRSEFFNLLNHPQFRQPGNVVDNPGNFGLSTQTLTRTDGTTSARQIQLALKLIF